MQEQLFKDYICRIGAPLLEVDLDVLSSSIAGESSNDTILRFSTSADVSILFICYDKNENKGTYIIYFDHIIFFNFIAIQFP